VLGENALMKRNRMLYTVFSKLGSPFTLEITAELGILPAKNWTATGMLNYVETLGDKPKLCIP
jgi:aldehyde:ferredoxin oxidoreductase